MNTYLIFRRGGWTHALEVEKAASRSSRVALHEMADRVRWIRSYVVEEPDGMLGTICVFEAEDSAALREHARRAALPIGPILAVRETVILDEDQAPPMAVFEAAQFSGSE
jgi:hypothetical protein